MGTARLIWSSRQCCKRATRLVRVCLTLGLLVIAACTRPLTPAESDFAEKLFGETLDTAPVRILSLPYWDPDAKDDAEILRGTERACVRTPQPRGAQPPQAFALGNGMHFSGSLQGSDMTLAWPKALRFPQAIIFAHEMTHVWQWQNRSWTGYTPWRALGESIREPDPYFSETGQSPDFLGFGYEQQAAIVEDYVCFAFANPTHPRRAELRALLEAVFPVDAFDAAINREGLIPNE